MKYTAILELLSIAIPALIAGTKKIVKGNEKYLFAVAAYFILKRWAEQAAVNAASQQIQSVGRYNHNALAQLYRQAMNPTGYGWTMSVDGTNEQLIFELARETADFTAVSVSYKTLYNSDLSADLRKELSTSDYQKFVQLLNRI